MMIIELYEYDRQFLIDILQKTHLRALIKNLTQAKTHPDCEDMILCQLSAHDAKELMGQLCFEANHSRSKKVIEHADAIAESIECQIC